MHATSSSPGTALGLLLFGSVVTFGSTTMSTAIMSMGQRQVEKALSRRIASVGRNSAG